MTIENETDIVLLFLGVCLVLLIAAIFLVRFVAGIYVPFIQDRDFIRMEIARSHGDERIHWKHELRRLYIAQIPFIGVSLAERSKRRSRERRKAHNSLMNSHINDAYIQEQKSLS